MLPHFHIDYNLELTSLAIVLGQFRICRETALPSTLLSFLQSSAVNANQFLSVPSVCMKVC